MQVALQSYGAQKLGGKEWLGSPIQGRHFFCKGLDSKHFKLYRPQSPLSRCSLKAALDDVWTQHWLCSNKPLVTGTEIWISYIFTCHEILSFWFFQPFKNIKIILSLWAIQNQTMGWTNWVTFNQQMILVTSPLLFFKKIYFI